MHRRTVEALVLLQAGDASNAILIGSLRTVVVRDASLKMLVLIPENEVPRLGRVVLERDFVSGQISFSGLAGRVREVELHAGVGEERRQKRKSLPIVELRALDAVARALQRFGDRDAMVANHTVRVRKIAIDNGAALDEALHIDVEQLEVQHARGVDVVLERSTVVWGAPRFEGGITVRAARWDWIDRTRLGFLQRVVERQASAPLA